MTTDRARPQDAPNRVIYKNAITYRRFNSGGSGGQHQNRSENAIEAALDPELAKRLGIPAFKAVASMKSQHANKKAAASMLRSKIFFALKGQQAKSRYSAGQKRVRNYHQPDDRVTDETGLSWSWRKTIGKGSLERCIDGRRDAKHTKPPKDSGP